MDQAITCYYFANGSLILSFVGQRISGGGVEGGEIEVDVECGPAEGMAVEEFYVVDVRRLGVGKPRILAKGAAGIRVRQSRATGRAGRC